MGGELLLQDEEEELSQCFAISWDVHQVRVMYLIHFKVRRFNIEKIRAKERFLNIPTVYDGDFTLKIQLMSAINCYH